MAKILLQQAVIFTQKIAKFTLCLSTSFFLLTACEPPSKQHQGSEKRSSSQLKRAIYSAHLQLDPHFAKAAADTAPIRDLFKGLMAFDKEGNLVPSLAKAWLSQDQQHWQIILNENNQWSNGEPVTATDFVASWQRLADPQNKSPLAPYLIYMGVKNAKAIITGEMPIQALGVQAMDTHTLSITLEKANVKLPEMLAHSALLPSYQGQTPQANTLISNGDYHLIHYTPTQLMLQANEKKTAFQQVSYQLITSTENLSRFDLVDTLLPHSRHFSMKQPRLCTYFYEFNFADPLMANKAIRQAIRLMISSTEISQGMGIPNHSVLPRTLQIPQDRRPSAKSPEQILREQGFHSQNPLKLTLTYDKQGQHEQIAHRIATILGRSDLFKVELQGVDWTRLLAIRQTKDFQLIRSGWCADYVDPLLFLTPFHSESIDNKISYHNDEVNQLLQMLQHQSGSETEQQKIEQLVALLDNDIAILPLFQYQRRLWVDHSVAGISAKNASEVIYSRDLSRKNKENKDE